MVTALENQFARTWDMWRRLIDNIPEEQWRSGAIDYLTPARHLCHVVVCADFYAGDIGVDRYDWNGLFGGDWEGMAPDELPTKAVALEKLSQVEAVVAAWLQGLDDPALADEETLFFWTGPTLLDRLLYLLRHTQHHLGELHGELRHREIPGAEWR
jgi:uncharacterized damage-inducible protein DinB